MMLEASQWKLLRDALEPMPDVEVQFFLRLLALCKEHNW